MMKARVIGALVVWGGVMGSSAPTVAGTGASPASCSTTDGTLIIGVNSPQVLYMLRARAWWPPNEATFWSLGLDFADLCVMSDAAVRALPRGPDIGVEGALFRCPTCEDASAVYRIDQGERHALTPVAEGLACLGLSADDVFDRATAEFRDRWPAGAALSAQCGPGASERRACGACGEQLRSCEASCAWGAWGACVEPASCAPEAPAPVAEAEARPTSGGCGAGSGHAGALLAALMAMGWRRRRRSALR